MSEIDNKLEQELNRLELEEAIGKDVLIEIFKILEEKTANSKDIEAVALEIRSLRERIETEGTSDREELRGLVKELIEEIRSIPEPPTRLDVDVKNPQKSVTIDNKTLNIKGKVKTEEGGKIVKAVSGLSKPLAALQKRLDEILRVQIVNSSDPKKPIAVRLSNGKKFYDAIYQAVGSSGWHIPFKKSNGVAKEGLVDDDGRLVMRIAAEDVDNLGTFQFVQGQFNANGNFELLTAGSGGSGTNEGIGYWVIETDFVVT